MIELEVEEFNPLADLYSVAGEMQLTVMPGARLSQVASG